MSTPVPEPEPAKPVPKPPMATHCPACKVPLAGNVAPHCDGRPKPCGWVRCKGCKRNVDPRRNRAVPAS